MKTLAFLLDGNRALLPDLVDPWQMCGTAVVTFVCCYLMTGERRRLRYPGGIAALWAIGIALQVLLVMWRYDWRERWTHEKHAAAVFAGGFPLIAIAICRYFPRKKPNQ